MYSSRVIEALKYSGFNRIPTHELYNIGTVFYLLSYQLEANWSHCEFITPIDDENATDYMKGLA